MKFDKDGMVKIETITEETEARAFIRLLESERVRHSGYEMSSKYKFSMVSTLVSDDEWALKKLGISSNPSQNIFGVHPEQGMTWRCPLNVM